MFKRVPPARSPTTPVVFLWRKCTCSGNLRLQGSVNKLLNLATARRKVAMNRNNYPRFSSFRVEKRPVWNVMMPQIDFRAPRLFVDAPLQAGATVALDRNQANYLGNVLRLSAGESILVFNGRDGEWRASISGRKRPESVGIVDQTRPQDRLPDLAYVFAPLKHARLDY